MVAINAARDVLAMRVAPVAVSKTPRHGPNDPTTWRWTGAADTEREGTRKTCPGCGTTYVIMDGMAHVCLGYGVA